MIKKSFPIQKPYFYDTKEGIDHFTKILVEENPKKLTEKEKLDIVAVATNTKGRSHFTCMASNLGAKAIFTEKPMAHSLVLAMDTIVALPQYVAPAARDPNSITSPVFAAPAFPKLVPAPVTTLVA